MLEVEVKMSNHCAVCSILCEKSCGHCKKVWYCSVDHQKSHRREHKEECFPAIEKENQEFGRYFVATRNIKPLEVIWTEKPDIIAPDTPDGPEVPPMCLGCCAILPGTFQTEFPKCSLCKWPLCSPSCKEIHWHSLLECELFQLNQIKPLDFHQNPLIYKAIKILRIIVLKRQHSKKWDKIISLKPSTAQLDFFHFKLNYDVCLNSVVSFFIDFICSRCNLNEDPQLIKKVINICYRYSAKQCLNQVVLPGRRFTSTITVKGGKLVHSCGPNTVPIISHVRSEEVLYATADIKPGDILTRTYLVQPTEMNFGGQVERRSRLLGLLQFLCKCSVCIDPTEQGTFYSAIKCQKKIGGGRCHGYFLPGVVTDQKTPVEFENQKWQCNSPSCKAEKSYSKLRKIIDSIQNQFEALGDGLHAEKLNLIEELENVTLHENHFLITNIRFSLLPYMLHNIGVICERENSDLRLRVFAVDALKTYALKCLEISEKFHPGSTLLRGVLLFFVVAENTLRVKYNISNPQPTEDMERFRAEALSILNVAKENTYGRLLYTQLQTEILIDRVYVNSVQTE